MASEPPKIALLFVSPKKKHTIKIMAPIAISIKPKFFNGRNYFSKKVFYPLILFGMKTKMLVFCIRENFTQYILTYS